MKNPARTAHLTKPHVAGRAADQHARLERKQRVLTHGAPSITASIADAVVIKHANLFFLSGPDGAVSFETDHGLGLYLNDCRYINGYELTVAGVRPRSLVAAASEGFRSIIELATPDIEMSDEHTLPKDAIGIRWEHMADGGDPALYDRITIRNYALWPVTLPVSVRLRAEFEDVFLVRGMLPPGDAQRTRPPTWRDGLLRFAKRGIDGRRRQVVVQFSIMPESVRRGAASFTFELAPRAEVSLGISIRVAELDGSAPALTKAPIDVDSACERMRAAAGGWLDAHTLIQSDRLFLNRLVDRSRRDLEMLRTWAGKEEFFSAGVPWFAALFGRDSAITAMQALSSDPTIAANTARVLAAHQGDRVDAWRDEQPGKILHELRVGELTRAGEIPYDPYYGSVDATPLFLLLIARYVDWTGDLSLFSDLRENVDRALLWIDTHGDRDADGYIEYQSESRGGLINQGWKDSGDAIVDEDGTLAEPPIALVEVQAYVCAAKRAIAKLMQRSGDHTRAAELERQAQELRRRINSDFWLDDLDTYAMALTADKRPTRVLASNAGHVLWAGVAEPDKAQRVTRRLLADDMFSGWGIRTLSRRELRYSPIGYHLGTVWPHDNAIIAAGMRAYGFDDEAMQVMTAVFDASLYFEHLRLPELYAGFAREEFGVPVRYPVANHPQAWGAGSVLAILEAMLGLMPNALDRRLRIMRPRLPPYVNRIDMDRLRVGDARAHLRFVRRDTHVEVEVIDIDGTLDVDVDYATPDGFAAGMAAAAALR